MSCYTSDNLVAVYAQVPDVLAILDMSDGEKIDACEKLDKMVDKIGREGLSNLMACDGKYPEDFKQARAFCRTCDLPGGVLQGCLSSTPLVFADQHDGDSKMVTLSGNKLTITSMGNKERYFMISLLWK